MSADNAGAPAILVVEDELLVRMFAVDALEDAGFRVLEAGTAAEAMKALNGATNVRAALIDMGLPDRPGDHLRADSARHEERPRPPEVPKSAGRGGRRHPVG